MEAIIFAMINAALYLSFGVGCAWIVIFIINVWNTMRELSTPYSQEFNTDAECIEAIGVDKKTADTIERFWII